MTPSPKFAEEYSAKIPALCLLSTLGWRYLNPEQALAARDGQSNQVVLRDQFRLYLTQYRFEYRSKLYPLSANSIEYIINVVCSPELNQGLIYANEKFYDQLVLGITVSEFTLGKKHNVTVPLIDWQTVNNNHFCVTEEFSVTRARGYSTRRPDIVCFVNGLPLVVIEAKRPDGKQQVTTAEGISQTLRNQHANEIPLLYVYSQIVLAINGIEAQYGTSGTDKKFWSTWQEEELTEVSMTKQKNKPLSKKQIDALFNHRKAEVLQWYQQLIAGGQLALTEQDITLIGLLSPKRLLMMTRQFIFFHHYKNAKIIARYHQVFAVKALLSTLKHRNETGARQGGVIWHTTGSGKSFTMTLLCKALLLDEALALCRFIVVTDRVDLETQLSETFKETNVIDSKDDFKKTKITTGKQLAEQIGHGTQRVIFTLVQKFTSATKLAQCYNPSENLIVLVDEGHRSQEGENNSRMQNALPNAAFIAFTGTPLLYKDKTTSKFGPILHAYTMQRAVQDKAIAPLLYEERKPELDINDQAIDNWFTRITHELTAEAASDLKRKFAKRHEVYAAEDRIRLIAYDIATYIKKDLFPGLKAQLACDSKLTAIKYKQYLDEIDWFESAVVISAPDTREGHERVDETSLPEIQQWWKNTVAEKTEKQYTKDVIQRFTHDPDLKLLIVVDKLLTGFDEPLNTVLFIDKSLKQHNLIQAIARVNRIHKDKPFGLLIDYRGVLTELDTTIKKYQDLASRTQGGFEIDDLVGMYQQMDTEYKKLPQLHADLWAIFSGVNNKADPEQMRQALIPKMELRGQELVDVHQKIRDDFDTALTQFTRCLRVAMQSKLYFDDATIAEETRNQYKVSLKDLSDLRRRIKQDTQQTVHYQTYHKPIKNLVNKHVVGVGIQEPKGVYEVSKLGKTDKLDDWSVDKARNETDIIKTRVVKMIEQNLQDDPYAHEAFSILLRSVIAEAEQMFDHPLKQYFLFKEFEQHVNSRRLVEIPNRFEGNFAAQAYFGVFKKVIPEAFVVHNEIVLDRWVKQAFIVDDVIKIAMDEHSLNPQNLESEVRKQLLPGMLSACVSLGGDLQQANKIIEMIVQIIRVKNYDDE